MGEVTANKVIRTCSLSLPKINGHQHRKAQVQEWRAGALSSQDFFPTEQWYSKVYPQTSMLEMQILAPHPRTVRVWLPTHVGLFVTPMDCSCPGSSVHGISQARILEWVAISHSRESSRLRDWNCISCIGRRTFSTTELSSGNPRPTESEPLGMWSRFLCCTKPFRWFWYTLKFENYCLKKTWEGTAAAAAESLQSCPTLCNPRDGSPPGSPVPGILQARTLEWVAISFSNA